MTEKAIVAAAKQAINDLFTAKQKELDKFIADFEYLNERFELSKLNELNYSITFKGENTTIVLFFPKGLVPRFCMHQIVDQLTVTEAIQRASNKSGGD